MVTILWPFYRIYFLFCTGLHMSAVHCDDGFQCVRAATLTERPFIFYISVRFTVGITGSFCDPSHGPEADANNIHHTESAI